MTVQDAVNEIIDASDYRVEKFVFPFKPWLALQLKNLMPKTIQGVVKNKAKM